jgi:predicted DCC family thiol-disulfide oxidoreductase YuxK
MNAMQRATVFFDGDCGFCRWSAEWLRRWDRGRRLQFATLGSAEADAALGDLDPATRYGSWHLATPDGRVRSAGAAIPAILRALPGGAPLAWLATVSPPLTEAAYRAISRNRDRLGRLLGRRACAVDPTRR